MINCVRERETKGWLNIATMFTLKMRLLPFQAHLNDQWEKSCREGKKEREREQASKQNKTASRQTQMHAH